MNKDFSMQATNTDGIVVLSLKEHHHGSIARVIYTGEVLPLATAREVREQVDGKPANNVKGSLYEVTVPSLDYANLLVRLPNTKPIVSQDDIDTKGVTLTFRCGDCLGVFFLSYDNQLLGYLTDLSDIEVVGIFG